MPAIPGTILASKISPGDTTATFPTHEDIYGKGGLMCLSTMDELTSLPLDRQKIGMLLYVNSNTLRYTLTSLSYPVTSYNVWESSLVRVTDFTTSRTFLSSDTSRVFHFDTTTQPLCAIFPITLPDGFNVAVMNTGTNTLRLSAAQLNSVGVTIGVRYGGAFVYKDNSQLFAVGRL